MDVVTDILLNLDAAGLGPLAARCRPAAAAVGATALMVETAHPDGGHRGFLVTLVVAARPPDGLPPTVAVRREANRALAALGVPHLAEDCAVERGVCAWYDGREQVHSGLTLLSVSTVSGDLTAEEHRVLIVAGAPKERAEDTVVGRVHAVVPAADPIGALEACLPLADCLGAVAVDVSPHEPAGRYTVALLARYPRPPGDTDTALRQVAAALAGRLGLPGNTVEITEQIGTLETDPPGPYGVRALYVREGVDPFNAHRDDDEDEEDEDPFGNLESPLTLAESRELRAVVQDLLATRVAFVADVAADDPIEARELVRATADRIRPAVTEAGVVLADPEPGDDGTVRVAAVFGPTNLSPATALAKAQAALAKARAELAPEPAGWSPVPTGDDDHLMSRWTGTGHPAPGIVRLELHAGPGLGLA